MSAPRDDHNIALHLEISTYTVAYERFSARSTQSRIASTGIHFCTPNYPRSLQLKNTPRDRYLSALCSPRSPVMPKYAKIGHSYCHENYTNEIHLFPHMVGPLDSACTKCVDPLSTRSIPPRWASHFVPQRKSRPSMRSSSPSRPSMFDCVPPTWDQDCAFVEKRSGTRELCCKRRCSRGTQE